MTSSPSVAPLHQTHAQSPSYGERHHRTTTLHSQASGHIRRSNNAAMSTASPEMINSLVESLSKIAGPPNTNLYGTPPSTAHAKKHVQTMFPSAGGMIRNLDFDYFNDEAALAPVVRTAKPPSGFSPLTNGSEENRRMSYHSSVDIPSYVRNYMNRIDREEVASRGKTGYEPTTSRRASWSSSKKGGRLSCVSSWERMKKGSAPSVKSLDGSLKERELRMTSAGILHTSEMVSDGGGRYSLMEEPEFIQGRHIPTRTSSCGKSVPRVVSYPAAVVTTVPPLQQVLPLHLMIDNRDDAAPPPGFPIRKYSHAKKDSKDKQNLKRRSSPPTLFSSNRDSIQSTPVVKKGHSSHPVAPASPHWDGRPSSADSIDDAVEAYLCSPRLSQKLRMPNGRVISFSEVGDPKGYAVFCCVGMGLTRYITAFYDELALSLGLRLITPDRPGVGESDPIDESERTVLSWPDDVQYICQSLQITKFSLLAHSAGAIYALATALRLGNHIRGKIHLLAPWIPPSQMSAMEAQLQVTTGIKKGKVGTLPTAQRILRALPTPILRVANSSFMTATSSSLTTSLPKSQNRKKRKEREKDRDRTGDEYNMTKVGENGSSERESSAGSDNENIKGNSKKGNTFSQDLSNEEAAMLRAAAEAEADRERQLTYDERLTHAIWMLSTRGANPAIDLLVCLERTRPVGFRYVDIMKDVVIHHGTKDNRVPIENVRWLGRMMRRCEVRELKSEGHGLMASAAVMGSVLEEIAGEWREWKRQSELQVACGTGRSRSDTINTLGGRSVMSGW
ncbi:Alpha/Beta hydrolase protein [Tirmania nivea]|nr:Alpha/Beta hydrolase protein [Tirmania nivea]